MLGTFPMEFSQTSTSQGYFPKRQILKGIFQSDNFPNVQFPNGYFVPLACSILSARSSSTSQPSAQPSSRSQPYRLALIAACGLENCTLGKIPIGKLSLGKSPLEKCKTKRGGDKFLKIYSPAGILYNDLLVYSQVLITPSKFYF